MSKPKTQSAISPYLTIDGVGEAIEYYKTVFDAELTGHMMAEDGKRYMHATMLINGAVVMMSDEFPEFGGFVGPAAEPKSSVAISVRYDRPEDVDRVYNLALKHGGTESFPPEDMFWGDRFAQFFDVKNHRWMLAAALNQA